MLKQNMYMDFLILKRTCPRKQLILRHRAKQYRHSDHRHLRDTMHGARPVNFTGDRLNLLFDCKLRRTGGHTLVRFYRKKSICGWILYLLVISRMAGARNEQHSVQTTFAANLQERGEKRKNSLLDPNSKNSIKFTEIYLTGRWIP